MSKYIDTISKWDEVARRGDIAAIHPAGRNGQEEFEKSGKSDANYILMVCQDLGLEPKALSILDYGCGPGRVSIPLCDYFNEVYGYDSSFEQLQSQINSSMRLNQFIVPSFKEPLIKNSFDVAFSLSVFIHHTYEDGMKMMREVAGVVKPGGYLLLQIPIYDYAKEAESWTGVSCWTLPNFYDSARMSGLEVIETHTNPGKFSYNNVGPNHHKFQILKKPE